MSRLAFTVILGLAAWLTGAAGFAQPASAPTATASSATSAGPTPYPKEASDWPGKGAIRVFPYMNDNRKAAWRERDRKQGSVVFAGDSLIGQWRTTMADDFPGMLLANRGIGGEPTRGLLFRFQEDVLDLHPKAIVLLTGTNDLSARQDIQETRSNIVDLLGMAERAMPGVPIVLCTLPPRDNPKSKIDPKLLIELNKLITSVAQGRRNVAVLDVYALLADPDGLPNAEYFNDDRLHLSAAGYRRLRDALLPVLKRLNVG